jgi:hypothetical protein
MIDLDEVWSEEDELYCRLGLLFIQNMFNGPQAFFKLTEYWRLRKYVFPDDRTLYIELSDFMYSFHRTGDPFDLYNLWAMARTVECCFPIKHQMRMAEILKENRPVAKAPIRGII